MLGLRGVRLGIVKDGLYRMQVRALVEAALLRQGHGERPQVEIMIPLVVNLRRARPRPPVGRGGGRRGAGRARRPTSTCRSAR